MSADPRSNGFYKTRFPKSGITPAYQLFADHLIEQLNQREYTLHEWHREKVVINFEPNLNCCSGPSMQRACGSVAGLSALALLLARLISPAAVITVTSKLGELFQREIR